MYVILPHREFGDYPYYLFFSTFMLLNKLRYQGIFKNTKDKELYFVFNYDASMDTVLNNLVRIMKENGKEIGYEKVEKMPRDLIFCGDYYGWWVD